MAAWTEEQDSLVVALYDRGDPLCRIALAVGKSQGSLDHAIARLKRSGRIRTSRPRKTDAEMVRSMNELYHQGYTLKDVAEIHGVSYSTAQRNVKNKRRGGWGGAMDPERVRYLYARGHSGLGVAQILGISHQRVYEFLRSEGLLRKDMKAKLGRNGTAETLGCSASTIGREL